MKRYCIKCREGRLDYFDILSESDAGFRIRLTRLSDGNEKIMEDSISRNLFNMCVKSGYIFEVESPAVSVA